MAEVWLDFHFLLFLLHFRNSERIGKLYRLEYPLVKYAFFFLAFVLFGLPIPVQIPDVPCKQRVWGQVEVGFYVLIRKPFKGKRGGLKVFFYVAISRNLISVMDSE